MSDEDNEGWVEVSPDDYERAVSQARQKAQSGTTTHFERETSYQVNDEEPVTRKQKFTVSQIHAGDIAPQKKRSVTSITSSQKIRQAESEAYHTQADMERARKLQKKIEKAQRRGQLRGMNPIDRTIETIADVTAKPAEIRDNITNKLTGAKEKILHTQAPEKKTLSSKVPASRKPSGITAARRNAGLKKAHGELLNRIGKFNAAVPKRRGKPFATEHKNRAGALDTSKRGNPLAGKKGNPFPAAKPRNPNGGHKGSPFGEHKGKHPVTATTHKKHNPFGEHKHNPFGSSKPKNPNGTKRDRAAMLGHNKFKGL